jgi:sigma-B regulation protein RsbU (phosphoserine phosphatase)
VKELEGKLDVHNRELRAATESLAAANDRHTRDLEEAARVQRAFLPVLPSELSGARFAWAFEPCRQLAGDYLSVFRLGERHAGLCVLDVAGHGVTAAFLSVMLSHLLTRLAAGPGGSAVPPAEVVSRLARELLPEATAGHTFSLLYGVLGCDTGEFRFVSAGHPGPVHLTEDKPPAKLEVTGFPVGVEGVGYKEQAVLLKPGDRLALYSDGLIGVRNADGEHFGTRRLLAALDEGRRLPLGDTLGGLIRAVEGWRGDVPRQDDLSVLLVERLEVVP